MIWPRGFPGWSDARPLKCGGATRHRASNLTSPGGTSDGSPAIHCRGMGKESDSVPSGIIDPRLAAPNSLGAREGSIVSSGRPAGDGNPLALKCQATVRPPSGTIKDRA
jgi:hypothetical protein